jgi:hypothetical protein
MQRLTVCRRLSLPLRDRPSSSILENDPYAYTASSGGSPSSSASLSPNGCKYIAAQPSPEVQAARALREPLLATSGTNSAAILFKGHRTTQEEADFHAQLRAAAAGAIGTFIVGSTGVAALFTAACVGFRTSAWVVIKWCAAGWVAAEVAFALWMCAWHVPRLSRIGHAPATRQPRRRAVRAAAGAVRPPVNKAQALPHPPTALATQPPPHNDAVLMFRRMMAHARHLERRCGLPLDWHAYLSAWFKVRGESPSRKGLHVSPCTCLRRVTGMSNMQVATIHASH